MSIRNSLVWQCNGRVHTLDASGYPSPVKAVRNMALIVDKSEECTILVWLVNGEFIVNTTYYVGV